MMSFVLTPRAYSDNCNTSAKNLNTNTSARDTSALFADGAGGLSDTAAATINVMTQMNGEVVPLQFGTVADYTSRAVSCLQLEPCDGAGADSQAARPSRCERRTCEFAQRRQ